MFFSIFEFVDRMYNTYVTRDASWLDYQIKEKRKKGEWSKILSLVSREIGSRIVFKKVKRYFCFIIR